MLIGSPLCPYGNARFTHSDASRFNTVYQGRETFQGGTQMDPAEQEQGPGIEPLQDGIRAAVLELSRLT